MTPTPIPITIITGFLGSGKTTILLNLIPQLPPDYRLALLKNEFGDLAIDSQLASANSISGVRELLNGCICCNLVGQLSDALLQLRDEVKPDRIVIETSGSAFPATLAMEVNRLAHEHKGAFVLDGVISVIDVENWEGYEDTSYTAKLQAKYTDLIIFNKWEGVPEQRFDVCLDRVADLELDTAWVKSAKGVVDKDVLLGIDGALLAKEMADHGHASLDLVLLNGKEGGEEAKEAYIQEHGHGHGHPSEDDHQAEVEVLSVSLTSPDLSDTINVETFTTLLLSAPKDEVYRIKGIISFRADSPPEDSSGGKAPAPVPTSPPAPAQESQTATNGETPTAEASTNGIKTQNYILNWAFGRWTYTPSPPSADSQRGGADASPPDSVSVARMTFILARGESHKWTRKLETGGLLEVAGETEEDRTGVINVERIG